MKDNYTFADILVSKITVGNKSEFLKASKAKYDSYNSKDWAKIYFDEFSGGFNVYHNDHNFSKKGGGGDAEKIVGKMLAKYNGKQVEFLPENSYQKSPDINFDDQTWDIKLINNASEGTIRNYIKDARKAENVIFYWDENDKLSELKNAVIRNIGYFKKKNTLNTMPNIYYMNKEGVLKSVFIRYP
ncbi:MAG: hypothetical protein LBQ01_08520 [Prevotellaceae bacterium]|jgi:hypothetical protein|nr:hypothetical protein [Prevotellaceae bacterium]